MFFPVRCFSDLRFGRVMVDFGQFRLRPIFFFEFGQFNFGQFRLRPISTSAKFDFGQFRLRPILFGLSDHLKCQSNCPKSNWPKSSILNCRPHDCPAISWSMLKMENFVKLNALTLLWRALTGWRWEIFQIIILFDRRATRQSSSRVFISCSHWRVYLSIIFAVFHQIWSLSFLINDVWTKVCVIASFRASQWEVARSDIQTDAWIDKWTWTNYFDTRTCNLCNLKHRAKMSRLSFIMNIIQLNYTRKNLSYTRFAHFDTMYRRRSWINDVIRRVRSITKCGRNES